MSYYNYDKFVHPVPDGYTIPKGTPTRSVYSAPSSVETFFTPLHDIPVESEDETKFYLTYDITRPKPPEEINSVIYNVRVGKDVFPVAVCQGSTVWSAFSSLGNRTSIVAPEIESFDTTPSDEEAEHDE